MPPIFSCHGRGRLCKCHVNVWSGVRVERVLRLGSHASNFAGPQRVRSVWQLGKVMTPANLLHRCAQHEASA